MKIAVLDAPSNLRLRPPLRNHLPGVYKLPKDSRAKGLVEKLKAEDGGEAILPEYPSIVDQVRCTGISIYAGKRINLSFGK